MITKVQVKLIGAAIVFASFPAFANFYVEGFGQEPSYSAAYDEAVAVAYDDCISLGGIGIIGVSVVNQIYYPNPPFGPNWWVHVQATCRD